jgi:hypothetical protein
MTRPNDRIDCAAEIEFVSDKDCRGQHIRLTLRGLPFGIHRLVSHAFSTGICAAGVQSPTNDISFLSKGVVVVEKGPSPSFEENASLNPRIGRCTHDPEIPGPHACGKSRRPDYETVFCKLDCGHDGGCK